MVYVNKGWRKSCEYLGYCQLHWRSTTSKCEDEISRNKEKTNIYYVRISYLELTILSCMTQISENWSFFSICKRNLCENFMLSLTKTFNLKQPQPGMIATSMFLLQLIKKGFKDNTKYLWHLRNVGNIFSSLVCQSYV